MGSVDHGRRGGRRRLVPGEPERAREIAAWTREFVDDADRDDGEQRERNGPARRAGLRVRVGGQLAHRAGRGRERRPVERRREFGLGQRREQGVGVEAQQARVVAREAADERAARQPREIVLLQRDHLPRRQLQLLRDGVDRQAGRRARGAQAHAGRPFGGGQGIGHRLGGVVRHSHTPVASAFVSAASG